MWLALQIWLTPQILFCLCLCGMALMARKGNAR